MPSDFAAALAAVERMKQEGVIAEYAVGGASRLPGQDGTRDPELLDRLHEDKRRLHAAARALSPEEKVRRVIELQRIVLPLIARRRALKPHEVVWE